MTMVTDTSERIDVHVPTLRSLADPAGPAPALMDAWRTDDEYVLLLDLPGVDPEHLVLSVEDDAIVIEAFRDEPPLDDVEWLRSERPRRAELSRTVRFGGDADLSQIEAHLDKGVLELRARRVEHDEPAKHLPVHPAESPAPIDLREAARAE